MEYTKGDLLQAQAEALVNTVNTVGVMGKGIALQFKEKYPGAYLEYKAACKSGSFKVGDILAYKDAEMSGVKWILHFPTKQHWKSKSRYEYIESGLMALREKLDELDLKSVAIPPLGCGNGGLEWDKVKPMIEKHLANSRAKVIIYEPNSAIKAVLQKEQVRATFKLTPARAMLLSALFKFESLGAESSLFVANKLAYFLKASGEPSLKKLNFIPHNYGPYSDQVRHVVYAMNGNFLMGYEQKTAKAFEKFSLNYNRLQELKNYTEGHLTIEQKDRLDSVIKLLNGFESTYSLELLSTVAYLRFEENLVESEEIQERLKNWSQRKFDLFQLQDIEIALLHIGGSKS